MWWPHCCPEEAPQKLILSPWQKLHPFSRYSFQSGDLSSSSEFRVVRGKERRQNIKVQPPPLPAPGHTCAQQKREGWAGSTEAEKQHGERGSKRNPGWGCRTDQLGLILSRIYNPKALGAKIININGMHATGKTTTKSCQNCCPQCSAGARKSPCRASPKQANYTGFLFSLPALNMDLQLYRIVFELSLS